MIDRIALSYGWTPSPWHYALAKRISPLAVYGLFRDAKKEETAIFIDDPDRYRQAVKFKGEINSVFPKCDLVCTAPKELRDAEHGLVVVNLKRKAGNYKPVIYDAPVSTMPTRAQYMAKLSQHRSAE